MDQANRRRHFPYEWLQLRRWAPGLLVWGAGCTQLSFPSPEPPLFRADLGSNQATTPAPVARSPYMMVANPPAAPAPRADAPPAPTHGPILQAAAHGDPPAALPEPEPIKTLPAPLPPEPAAKLAPAKPANVLPISLDTVLRLAEEQNAQIALARERVREAYAERDVAKSHWLPDLYVGTAYYRHEGGIQNEDGTLTHSSFGALFSGLELDSRLDIRDVAYQVVNAQRKVWQQKGELSRVTSETLLEAANTYIDLLTALTGEAVTADLEKKLSDLHDRAQKVAAVEAPARADAHRIQAELESQRQTRVKLHAQSLAAAAKLLYLLHLDPCAELLPVDQRLVAFELVDPTPPTCDLVTQALTTGPGVREMEGLLALIQDSIAKSKGIGQLLPIFEMRMAEGGFGAAPGARLDWDNRWDLGLQARWNITPWLAQRERQRVTRAKIQQAHLAYDDLRGKLTAGVQEARETSLAGREQIDLGATQVREAQEAYRLVDERLRLNPQPTTYNEALLTIGSFGRAQVNYLSAINAYDKAQLRLMVLLGPAACKGPVEHPAH